MRNVLCCLFLLLLDTAVQAAERDAVPVTVLAGKVTRVIDGDTLDVLLSSGTIRVRLHGVDAPERDQPGGAAATSWLTLQLRDQQVMIEPISQDQYDRMVAVVHMQDRNINRELVQAGQAWAYRRFMRRSDAELCALEDQARLKGAGLWADAAHAPWEYRATNGKGPFTNFGKTTARECTGSIGR